MIVVPFDPINVLLSQVLKYSLDDITYWTVIFKEIFKKKFKNQILKFILIIPLYLRKLYQKILNQIEK